jgi:hypothetical protein
MVGTTSGVIFTKVGANTDLVILQGNTINFSFIWGGSTPINNTGFDAIMQIRESLDSAMPIAEFSVGNGRITVGGANGAFNFFMDDTDSANLPALSGGVYSIKITDGAGFVYQAASGSCVIKVGATR